MTANEINALGIGVDTSNVIECLSVESAVEWVKHNTTYIFPDDYGDTAGNVRFFISKFMDIMARSTGVTSESIEGLSQSYASDTTTALLWQYANDLLGEWMKPGVTFTLARRKW